MLWYSIQPVFITAYNDGVEKQLFSLEGTIAVKFRGNEIWTFTCCIGQQCTFSTSIVSCHDFSAAPGLNRLLQFFFPPSAAM